MERPETAEDLRLNFSGKEFSCITGNGGLRSRFLFF